MSHHASVGTASVPRMVPSIARYLIYYTSKALLNAEIKYPMMKKWALALIVAA